MDAVIIVKVRAESRMRGRAGLRRRLDRQRGADLLGARRRA
jgi:hypothetical protein